MEIKQSIRDVLKSFTGEGDLFVATTALLAELGIRLNTSTREPINGGFATIYSAVRTGEKMPKDAEAILSRVAEVYLIGSVSDDTLAGGASSLDAVKDAHYNGMLVFAADIAPGKKTLTRTELAAITRIANRCAKDNPVTVVFREGESISIATCERTAYKQAWRPGERLGKVSILKGVNCLSPHRGHIDILESMNVKACKTFDALYKKWKEVFSTSLLAKQFYREIQNWYFWALKKEQNIAFPNARDDDSDDEKYNPENVIRLITRLIFTWFMKEKGLVNPDLFSPEFLKKALKHFNPVNMSSEDGLDKQAENFDCNCTYYRAILQNLFFATFNQEIKDRGFVKEWNDTQKRHVKNYYRGAKLFNETDEKKIIDYFNGAPFVNGGLFECLDNVEQNGKVYSWDGFSNNEYEHGLLNCALIPDYLFFGGETTTDLSEFFEKDKSAKSVKVRGIINILNDYVFTIEENTPFDEDVALDPELLGKVFENLLGCYNPETQQMARNATGSFYTPREIVNYMVKTTLKSYLKRICPMVAPTEIDALVEGAAELVDLPSVTENAKDVLTALFKAKILDPACGSGAFPMGIMSALVEILRTVDPDNKHWYEIVLKESLVEAASIADVGDEQEREVLKAQIEYDFNERVDHPDYARKLYIIEHCIFGADIQPIAVQISRLRFFITLLCEQTKNNDPAKNYGITPLPNLESNFVAANSLLSLDLKDMRELLGQKKIVSLVKQLRGIRHQLFLPKTSDKKKRLQEKDKELRKAISAAAEGLYDENIEQRSQILKTEMKRIDEELAKLGKDDFVDSVRNVEEVDLFGEKTVTTKKVIGKGNVYLKKKKDVESELVSLKNASRKERLLSDLKRLVAWNPFAFNVAETFLDPEWMFGVKDGFDVVIGNPPYRLCQPSNTDPVLLELYRKYKVASYKIDLFHLFYEMGLNVASAQGLVAYITSNTYLTNKYVVPLRRYILDNSRILQLVMYPNEVFDSACVEVATILLGKGTIHDAYHVIPIYLQDETGIRLLKEKKQDDWGKEQECVFTIKDNTVSASTPCINLGKICNTYFGIQAYDKKTSTSEDKLGDDWLPIVDGADVVRYGCLTPHNYFHYVSTEIKSGGDNRVYSRERVLVRQIGMVPFVGYVESGTLTSNTIYNIYVTDEKYSIKYILGILSSSYIRYYWSDRYSDNKKLFPKIKGYQLRELPIPDVGKNEQDGIVAIVEEIIATKKSDPSADTSALEAEIDEKVFDLYGLTPEEREIVKGGVK